ncbi:DNA annealing helicase and endonuclease ZRANB3 [Megalops cyprinoides]|uniref:DNA annealing helicase and endonuclease ZRANB3 n=1 Tax=Megalops cyprinoides TaxID=118141 RepID=UPI001864A5D0|nr:DNA annealing helicase and endonuclease ZRANB3 [Megalops cyprinoides]
MNERRDIHSSLPQGFGKACPENEQDNQLLNLPEKMRQRLMPFQREGVKFALARNGRCMIADEMGLGKTIQAISVAYMYRHEWPLLIVVPSSLKYPWIEEMEKWIPELAPEDINLVENKTDIAGIGRSKVTVLGYGLLTTDARALVDALTKQNFRVVLVDESHYLKSRNAARSQILVPLVQKAKRAILLTGTPALGRPEELFMQIDALYPRRFGSWSDYAKKYCNAHFRFFGNRRQWDCRGASHLEELHQRLSEIMIRRLKAQVLTQLPPKVRQRIPFDLPKDAAKEASASFEEWEKLMRKLDSGAGGDDNPFVEVMGLITRMYKQTAIAKAGAVKDYIKMMLENERLKFLVFAHHLTMLQACTEAVIEAKARYVRIDGSVPSSERIQLVHQFQNDPDTRVAILSIQAAGQGLTFTAATHVVFAELYWNPGHVKQAEDRAHRIGQTSSVHVHYLIAKGTFDTIMWGMLNRKETVTGSTLNGKKEYLKAEIGDKGKWDFLNFAQAWTPSEALDEDAKGCQDVFFSHFEKDRQHDIRTFFSPSARKERKRSRPEDEDATLPPSEQGAERGEEQSQPEGSRSGTSGGQDEDFSPQTKRLRFASPQPSAVRKTRRSWTGKASSPFSLLASRRLSEGAPAPPVGERKGWSCTACTYFNSTLLPYCEMCETARSVTAASGSRSSSVPLFKEPGPGRPPESTGLCVTVSSSDDEPDTTAQSICDSAQAGLPVYEGLKFCASRNTDRIYLYTKEGTPLNCNFIPMDIQLDSWDDLPEAFGRSENRRQVLRFVREWSALTAMKQRVVRRSGRVFRSPILAVDEITSGQRRQSITKRFLTKEDVAQASLSKAQRDGGTVRIAAPEGFFAKKKAAPLASPTADKKDGRSSESRPTDAPDPGEGGYLQAVDGGGNPLCLSCQRPCGDARFCGRECQEEFQVRSSQGYMRARVLEAEQGVCQHCGLHAHQLFQRVRDAPPGSRKELLESTWLSQLSLKQLNEMIRNPAEGQFWQVDHIRPVYSGGGQCSLDNLQTLCTVCHRERTAQQAKERSQTRKGIAASKVASDITRFLVKK